MKLTLEQTALADELNSRQKLFVFGLMSGKTQRQAYYDAGGKAKTDQSADASASEMLSNPKVKAFYDSLMDEVAEEAQVTVGMVVKGLLKEAQDNSEGSTQSARVSAWAHLGRHLGLFVDKVQHSGQIQVKQQLGELLDEISEDDQF